MSAGDLAFNGDGFFMAANTSDNDTLVRINQTTYNGTAVGSDFGFNRVYGLETGDDGVLYGVTNTIILEINTSNGAGTVIRNYSGLGNSWGSSFIAEATTAPIPEPTTMLLFGTGLLGLLGFRKKYRK